MSRIGSQALFGGLFCFWDTSFAAKLPLVLVHELMIQGQAIAKGSMVSSSPLISRAVLSASYCC